MMSDEQTIARRAIGSRQQRPAAARLATRAVFLSNGLILSSWVPLIPLAKERLAMSEAVLGLVLLALGAGALVAMPASGLLIVRFGSRRVVLIASLIFFSMLPILAWAPAIPLLAASLFVFGAASGTMDIAMNAQGVAVEHLGSKPIFSSLHGMFSVGGILGASLCGALMHLSLNPVIAAAAISLTMAILVISQYRAMLPGGGGRSGGKSFSRPAGLVVLLGLLALAGAMAEGAMMDWSAVFLRFNRGFGEATAGLGFAAFSLTMATGRLTGDWVVTRIGTISTIRYGSALAAFGMFLATANGNGSIVLIGFALTGLGLANVVPQLFGIAGRLPGLSPGVAISAVATLAYAGILAGPPVIGPLAQITSLPIALSFVAGSLVLVAIGAGVAATQPRSDAGTG